MANALDILQAQEPPAAPEAKELLVFVEAHYDGVDGADGLDGSYDMALSPDGLFAYVAAMNDDAISVFSRDVSTGKLTYLSRTKNAEDGVEGLNGVRSLALSPDGDHLYAVSMFDDALVSFSRDHSTGAIAYLGRIKDAEAGVDGLDGARSVEISPDGRNLYVTGWAENALALFSRDPLTGVVGFLGRLKHGEDGIYALDAPHFVTVSPDGKSVYVALWDMDAVSVFDRDSVTGILTYNSKVEEGTADAAGKGVNGIRAPRAVLASPDGNQVYVVSWNDDAVTTFNRNATGALEFVSTHRSKVNGVFGMDGAHSIALSADGKFIYVASFFDDAVTVFARDTETGTLSYDQSIYNTDEGVEGLNGNLTVIASPDGEHVYSLAASDKSLVAFRRELIVDPPVFQVEPESQSIPANSSVSFTALAEGVEVSYQWKANGLDIPGATASVYSIDPVGYLLDQTVYTVEASNSGGSVLSSEAVLSVLPEVTLLQPESLTALTQSSSSALLNWIDASPNESGFEIQRKAAGGSYETVGQVLANKISFEDTGLAAGTEYIYRVRATGPGVVSLWSNEAVVESFDKAPNSPENLMVSLAKYNRVQLEWQDRSVVEDGYAVERQDAATGGAYATVGTVGRSATSYLDRSVSPEKNYNYRVRAYNESGNSGYSNTVEAFTAAIPVSSISPVSREVSASLSEGNTVLVASDTDWEAIPDVSWIVLESPFGGSGFENESVSYRVLENKSLDSRVGTIDIGGLVHTVTQLGTEEKLIISPTESVISSDGGAITLSIEANIPWNVVPSSEWVSVTSGSSGSENGLVELQIAPNLSVNDRVSLLSINEQSHRITQKGAASYVIVSPVQQAIPSLGGSFEFQVKSNTSWTLSSTVDWLTIDSATSGAGSSLVRFSAAENATSQSRSGAVTANGVSHVVTQGPGKTVEEPATENPAPEFPPRETLPAAPGPPVAGGASNDVNGGILITWEDQSDSETGYIVERTISGQEQWVELARLPANTTAYLDETAVPGVAYTYRVSAYNDEGVSVGLIIDSEGWIPKSRLVNLSTRGYVGVGDNIMIAGFGVSGSEPLRVLSRSVGPKLRNFDLGNALGDPMMALWDQRERLEIDKNDDWRQGVGRNQLVEAEAMSGAFSIADSAKEAALMRDYNAGLYTALLSGVEGQTGIALIELYELVSNPRVDARLTNLSTRGYVGQGDSVMIGGFVIAGQTPLKLLIRGVGPQLAERNLAGCLVDPMLSLYSGKTVIAQNNDWGDEGLDEKVAAFHAAGAFPLTEGGRDSAMLVTLDPGPYTVILQGASGETGLALFEIYVLD